MTKKIVGIITALSIGLTMAGPALGATVEELQAQINALLAQLNALQAQLAALTGGETGGVPAACTGITFTRDLTEGMSGADVKCLQALLNVTPQTGYFGPLTKSAVIKFQEDNAASILTPLGLTSGTGYVGAKTRAKLNELLTPTVTPPTAECTVDADCPTGKVCVAGRCVVAEEEVPPPEEEVTPEEGYFTFTLSPSPVDTTVYRGSENVGVMAFTLKANNSDITVQRVTLKFNVRPWLYVSHISLYEGANAIKGVEATSTAFEQVSTSDYRLHLTGLNVKIAKGTTKTFTVKVSVPSVTHSTGAVTVTLVANAIRGVDTAGLQQYAPSDTYSRTFTVETATTGAIEVSLATDSPLEGPAILSTTATTEDVPLAKINLKAKYSNIKVTTIKLTGSYTTSGSETIATALPVVKIYDGDTLLKTAAGAATMTFDLSDAPLEIAKDTTKTLTVKADVAKIATGYVTSGAYASVSLTANTTNVVGEDATYAQPTVTGGATGYSIHFYEKAPSGTLVSTSIKQVEGSGTGAKAADWSIKLSITALGGDIYIRRYDSATPSNSGLVAEKIESGIGGTLVFAISSDAATSTHGWYIPVGSTKTFTVSGYIPDGGSAGMNGAKITKIRWHTSNSDTGWTDWTWSSIPLVFKTDKVYVSN